MKAIDNLIIEAEQDGLLPEFYKILRETPKYSSGEIIFFNDVRHYLCSIENKYLRIKYLDGGMNE